MALGPGGAPAAPGPPLIKVPQRNLHVARAAARRVVVATFALELRVLEVAVSKLV